MAARILRLRLAVLLAPLRRGPADAARAVAGALVIAAAAAVGCWGLLLLRDGELTTAAVVTVFSGSALTVGFIASPLVTGATDPLDPRAFRAFGFASVPLATSLAAVGVLSVPILAVIALAVCMAVTWRDLGAAWPAAVGGALLGVLTCVLAARVFSAIAATVLAPRRSRELTGLIVIAIIVVVAPVVVFFASLGWEGDVPDTLLSAVRVLADTPLGAAWALPWRPSAVSITVAFATVLVLAASWWALVDRTLRTTERPAVSRGSGGLGWFAVTPGTPAGAVAARSLIYWFTDRRYLANLVILPIVAVVAMVPLLVVGVPFTWVVLIPAPLLALFLGWLPHNDLAYDSTAVWLHVATGVRGVADRMGRLVPGLIIGVVVLAVTIPVSVGLHGDWSMAPVMIGACASLFLGGLGLSSISSAAAPSPVTRPGDSPFRQPERTSASGAFAQGGVLAGALLVSTPVLWWGWLATTAPGFADLALWGGIGIGAGVFLMGLAVGSVVFERRGTRLLEFAEAA